MARRRWRAVWRAGGHLCSSGGRGEQLGQPVRQQRRAAVLDDRVRAADQGGCGDDVAAGTAGIHQRPELAGGVAELGTVGQGVVAVRAARGRGHGVGGGQRLPVPGLQLGEGCLAVRPGGRVLVVGVGLGLVGVDNEQPGGSAGDPDAVRGAGPGAEDSGVGGGGALLPSAVSASAPGVGAVAAGGGVAGAGRPLLPGDEWEDVPAAGGVEQSGGAQLVDQPGGRVGGGHGGSYRSSRAGRRVARSGACRSASRVRLSAMATRA